MQASALANAEYWLSIISTAKLVAAFLVAIGVAIEFGGDWVARPFERTIEAAKSAEIARLSAEAESARAAIADANKSASEAIAEAAKLGVSFGNLNEFVAAQKSDNDKTLTELRKDAADLNKARGEALAAAEGTKRTLADMSSLLEKQRSLQQKMINAMAPRNISADRQQIFIDKLKEFQGLVFVVFRFQASTPDTPPLSNLLHELLSRANWQTKGITTATSAGYAKGIVVLKRIDASAKAGSAVAALLQEFSDNHLDAGTAPDFTGDGVPALVGTGMVAGANSGPPFPDIIIVVGDKP